MPPYRVACKDRVPSVGKLERRHDRDGERILRRPRCRAIEQHAKLDGQRLHDRGSIDPVTECDQRRAIVRRKCPRLALRDAADVDRSLRLVKGERFRAKYFGEAAVRITPRKVELEEPIRSLHVTFGKEKIVFVARADMRDVSPVADDRDRFVQAGDDDATVRRRRCLESGLDVRSIGEGNSYDAGCKGERVPIDHARNCGNHARVGALKHARIGSLEKAHVRSIQRPTMGLRDGGLADRVGVLQHPLAVLLAFPSQKALQAPLLLQHCLRSQYRERLFGELIDNRHQIVDATFDRVAQVGRKVVRYPEPQPMATVGPGVPQTTNSAPCAFAWW